ncbi:hypothetical protein IGI04_031116 [Brassica rapa subsp. trilocularis]|uniref:Transmembrane protein n=1 Tax=Brassica rapa subsp. trilocularis TaxID=1813537 RepID=A0ABQ7LVE9_BRACM|nr:hypothetical protein IGI04_031116 [Brassica rapa subsp. trilocularis]
MRKVFSLLGFVFFLLLLLGNSLVLASKQESLPRAGRRMISYQTDGQIDTGPSYSGRGGGRNP